MLSPTQMLLSRKTLKKLGLLALPNKLEKSFSIYNSSFDDQISRQVKKQVEQKQIEVLDQIKLKAGRNRLVARSLDAVSLTSNLPGLRNNNLQQSGEVIGNNSRLNMTFRETNWKGNQAQSLLYSNFTSSQSSEFQSQLLVGDSSNF